MKKFVVVCLVVCGVFASSPSWATFETFSLPNFHSSEATVEISDKKTIVIRVMDEGKVFLRGKPATSKEIGIQITPTFLDKDKFVDVSQAWIKYPSPNRIEITVGKKVRGSRGQSNIAIEVPDDLLEHLAVFSNNEVKLGSFNTEVAWDRTIYVQTAGAVKVIGKLLARGGFIINGGKLTEHELPHGDPHTPVHVFSTSKNCPAAILLAGKAPNPQMRKWLVGLFGKLS